MARTPLFTRLERALKIAAFAHRNRTSASETVERFEESRATLSRRQFLGSAAAVAGAIVIPPALARLPQMNIAPRVVIVGAGMAGLTAAYRLQQSGIPSRVLEAANRVGGRMYSLRDFFPDGQVAELGGEFIDSGHIAMRRMARHLGLTLTDLAESDVGLTSDAYYFNGRLISDEQIIAAFMPVAARIIADLETLTGDGDVTYDAPNNGEALDMSLAEWFDTRDVRGVIRDLLEVAYIGEYGLDVDQQSAFNLLWLIGTDEGAFDVFGVSDERYHIAEGNDAIPNGLAARLETPVELETRLEAIRQDSAGVYMLTVNRDGTVEDIEADEVVLTLPFTLLRQVDIQVELPPTKRQAINELGYGTNSKLMVGFETRPWREMGYAGGSYSDLPYQSSWETSKGQSGAHGILTNYTGGAAGVAIGEGTPEARAAEFAAQIDQVFPGTGEVFTGQAARFHWTSYPLALGSYSCYKPGQTAGLRGAEGEAVDGLHFAGEHTSLDYQGYMNGACESGERVAREVRARVRG